MLEMIPYYGHNVPVLMVEEAIKLTPVAAAQVAVAPAVEHQRVVLVVEHQQVAPAVERQRVAPAAVLAMVIPFQSQVFWHY